MRSTQSIWNIENASTQKSTLTSNESRWNNSVVNNIIETTNSVSSVLVSFSFSLSLNGSSQILQHTVCLTKGKTITTNPMGCFASKWTFILIKLMAILDKMFVYIFSLESKFEALTFWKFWKLLKPL